MSAAVKYPNTITLSKLKIRGWSIRLIDKLLGSPDYTVPNPVYRSAPCLKLYNLPRVIAAEDSPEFQSYSLALVSRKAAAVKAVETKRDKTKQFISDLEIEIERFDLDKLATQAIGNYNAHHCRQWDEESRRIESDSFADWSEPDTFRDRICVNYLRHRCSGYHSHLEFLASRIGRDEAYLILFKKIMDKIAIMYPELAVETARQYAEKTGET